MAKLSPQLEAALNSHVGSEFASSHQYLASSAALSESNWLGMAKWMRMQATEEDGHAHKFYDHMLARGANVTLGGIAKPKSDFKGPLDVFEDALARERKTTVNIDALMDLAVSKKDYALQIFLQWFITEQVEEEEQVRHIVDRLKMLGSDKGALLLIDRELGARTTTA